ncbi:NrsF family protein [Reyranella sp.]|uniref:NrsF family protein n=1 Tax=Reyranella sp. TaxID=1929291 RepID=UPI003784C793
MKTANLIEALVADRATSGKRVAKWMTLGLASALVTGAMASLALFLVALGVRADIAEALGTWRFELKVAMVLLALGLAFSLCVAWSRPVTSGRAAWRLLPLAALAVAAVAIELAALPGAAWVARLVGSNAVVCLAAIPALAIAPLAAVLWILRAGAPASPALAGAAAGLLAATAGATLYAFHCFDDSPLFVVTWYALAAVPVIALGAIVGRRLLRW